MSKTQNRLHEIIELAMSSQRNLSNLFWLVDQVAQQQITPDNLKKELHNYIKETILLSKDIQEKPIPTKKTPVSSPAASQSTEVPGSLTHQEPVEQSGPFAPGVSEDRPSHPHHEVVPPAEQLSSPTESQSPEVPSSLTHQEPVEQSSAFALGVSEDRPSHAHHEVVPPADQPGSLPTTGEAKGASMEPKGKIAEGGGQPDLPQSGETEVDRMAEIKAIVGGTIYGQEWEKAILALEQVNTSVARLVIDYCQVVIDSKDEPIWKKRIEDDAQAVLDEWATNPQEATSKILQQVQDRLVPTDEPKPGQSIFRTPYNQLAEIIGRLNGNPVLISRVGAALREIYRNTEKKKDTSDYRRLVEWRRDFESELTRRFWRAGAASGNQEGQAGMDQIRQWYAELEGYLRDEMASNLAPEVDNDVNQLLGLITAHKNKLDHAVENPAKDLSAPWRFIFFS